MLRVSGRALANTRVTIRPLLVAVTFVWGVLWFALLGAHALFNPDEGRYAEIPREMLASGNLLVPRLNGIIYIEKPPLQYWASVASYRLFGVSDWSARVPVGIAGLLTILLVYGFVGRVWGKAAAWRASLVGGSMLLPVLMAHHLTLDTSLTLFTTAALAAFCLAQIESSHPGRSHRWMLIAWVAAALGVLTKGIVAVFLPAVTLVVYSLLQRDRRVWRRLSLRAGLPLFMLVAAPWFIGMSREVPGFLDFFFVREHLQRYLTTIEQRQEPWWFFLPVLLVGLLPWVPSAVRALATGWRSRVRRGDFDMRRFLWCWVVVTVVFFSASDSKLVPYILPVYPPLWMLMASGDEAAERRDTARTAWVLAICGVLLASFAIAQPALAHRFGVSAYSLTLRPALFVIAFVLIVGAIASRRARRDLELAHIAIAATAFASVATLLYAARGLTPLYSGEPLARAVAGEVGSAPVYAVRTYDQTLPFYLGRTVTLVAERNEMDFGLRLEPWRSIESWAEFAAQWRGAPQAFAVVDERDLEELRNRGLSLYVRARAGREVLVSRNQRLRRVSSSFSSRRNSKPNIVSMMSSQRARH
ncbi:MAG TPA: glycosyltransferase family 39 protein [Steroidobacteraceae bacterium]|nr:glycosyltransferase family 39 protein [Steroidobacteraceae bacterium]